MRIVVCSYCFVFFFFKQKTAYEMRISDWSSDVCSSDLFDPHGQRPAVGLDIGEDRRHSSRESLAGKGGQRCLYWLTGFELARNGFRYGGVEPNGAKAINLRQRLARRHRHAGTHAERFDDTAGWSRHGDDIVRPSAAFNCGDGDRKSTRLNSSHQCAPRMP